MNNLKLLERLENNQKNVRYGDFVTLIQAFGFKRARGKGSHEIFRRLDIPEIINIQNDKGNAKPYQIKQFLSLVEIYDLRLEEN